MSTNRIASHPATGGTVAPNPFADASPLRSADGASSEGLPSFATLLSRQASQQGLLQGSVPRAAPEFQSSNTSKPAQPLPSSGTEEAHAASQREDQPTAPPRQAEAPKQSGEKRAVASKAAKDKTPDGKATRSRDDVQTPDKAEDRQASDSSTASPLGGWLAALNLDPHAARPVAASAGGDAAGKAAVSATGTGQSDGAAVLAAWASGQAGASEAAGAAISGVAASAGPAAEAGGLTTRGAVGKFDLSSDRAAASAQAAATGLDAVRMLGADAQAAGHSNMQAGEGSTPGWDAALLAASEAATAAAARGASQAGTAEGVSGHISAPVGSSGFADALGEQVRVLVTSSGVRETQGQHEARLSLNPAELGPVTIRIAMDGQQAQIEFSAAHESTRRAIEDSLPALAGALQSEGLTLSGGGVYDQRQPSQAFDDAQAGSRSQAVSLSVPRSEGASSGQGSAARVGAGNGLGAGRGAVDLYA